MAEEIRQDIDSINWFDISIYQKLSEEFIREFADKVNWENISIYQTLSEDFIREFADKLDWYSISFHQKLSEEFIREFADKVHWDCISSCQNLSEEFICEFKDKVSWFSISLCQNLSEEFRAQKNMSKAIVHTKEQKLENMNAYAKKYDLKIENDTLFAYRQHDNWNHGVYNRTITYDEIGKRYEDWHCDPDSNVKNSFGLGIFPNGNVEVSVHVDDWGVWVKDTNKGRVLAFTLLNVSTFNGRQ
jgi:hypothetical protein